jgi:hypothetical protein
MWRSSGSRFLHLFVPPRHGPWPCLLPARALRVYTIRAWTKAASAPPPTSGMGEKMERRVAAGPVATREKGALRDGGGGRARRAEEARRTAAAGIGEYCARAWLGFLSHARSSSGQAHSAMWINRCRRNEASALPSRDTCLSWIVPKGSMRVHRLYL